MFFGLFFRYNNQVIECRLLLEIQTTVESFTHDFSDWIHQDSLSMFDSRRVGYEVHRRHREYVDDVMIRLVS